MKKTSNKLKVYYGSQIDFDNWAKQFVNHMARVHIHWRYALNWMSNCDEDLSFAALCRQHVGPLQEPAEDLAIKLEATLLDYLPDSLAKRRIQLSGGTSQECNGFTMWRRLHRDYQGSGDAVEYAGTEALREYGRCGKISELSAHMDGWLSLLDRYGGALMEAAPRIVRSMFLDIIPTELKSKINKKRVLRDATHLELVEYCRNHCDHQLTEALADVQDDRAARR